MNIFKILMFIVLHAILLFSIISRARKLLKAINAKSDASIKETSIKGELFFFSLVLIVSFLIVRFVFYPWFYENINEVF